MSAVQAAAGEQFFVTHCVTADSVLGSPGYGVRAASVPPPADDLRLALEYPPYELPLEMWPLRPAKVNTPRRLARTKHPVSGVWVAHSVYLEKDTMNRDRSYFTHLLHLPASADPADVLRSWDAPDWAKEYPPGATKTLPRTKLPAGSAVSDEGLTEFLSEAPTGLTDVAVTVCPARLRAYPERRRELVGRFLRAVTLAADAHDGRDRLFVHAEPGLVALLLYAAVRLLPPAWTADLTFSTFEPHHKGLRDYKLATVVGTYFGVPGKALGPDLASVHGYALDTITPERSSAEISGPVPPGLLALVDLAAEGEWELLADVHRLVGTGDDALAMAASTIPLARAMRQLNRGEPTIDDLLALHADPRGAAALARVEEKVWPHVRAAALFDSRVRAGFKDWLTKPGRLDEFRRHATRSLLRGDLAGWDAGWHVIRGVAEPPVARDQLERAIKSIDRHLPELPLVARTRLRIACTDCGAWPGHHLLAPTGPDELDVLLAPKTPADWQGYACFAVLGPDDRNWLAESTTVFRPALRTRVRRHLLSAPAAVLAGYAGHIRDHLAELPGLLDGVLLPHEPECVDFLGRLIDAAASRIHADDWRKLLSRLDIYGAQTPEWSGFLLRDDHLAKLLAGFKADPAATRVWADYLALLSPDLFDGDEWERTLFGQLKKAKEALTGAGIPLKAVLPPGGPAKLNAADTILAVQADPKSAEKLADGELPRAYQVFGIEPVDGLRSLYIQGEFHLLDLPADRPKLKPFVAAFLACYPVTHEYYSARTAVTQWLVISESCDERSRASFQALFVREYVPDFWHRDILDESRRVPILPEAEARIREGIAARRPGRRRR